MRWPRRGDSLIRTLGWRFLGGGIVMAIVYPIGVWSDPNVAVGPIYGVLFGAGVAALGLLLLALSPPDNARRRRTKVDRRWRTDPSGHPGGQGGGTLAAAALHHCFSMWARCPPEGRNRPGCDSLRVETAMRTPRAPLVLLLLALISPAAAQPRDLAGEEARERSYVDALRREDAAIADRYVALRDARARAIADLRRAQERFNAMPPELRAGFVSEVRQAERAYAERSLALLDFLDARDRGAIARYEEEIGRVRRHLEERGATRAELEKLRRGN